MKQFSLTRNQMIIIRTILLVAYGALFMFLKYFHGYARDENIMMILGCLRNVGFGMVYFAYHLIFEKNMLAKIDKLFIFIYVIAFIFLIAAIVMLYSL